MAMSDPSISDDEPLHRLFTGSDDYTRTRSSSLSSIPDSPSIPVSGAQTPAVFRPLLRRRSSLHHNTDSPRHTVSEENVPQLQNSLRKAQGWLDGKNVFSPRPRTDSSPQPHPTHPKTPPPLHSATQMARPAGPHRRISHEVHEREQSLRHELDRLRHQVRDRAERRQEETRTVEFALNRIAETQMNHMKVQQVLLERVGALDLQAKETREELRRARRASEWCEDRDRNREGE